MQKCNHPHTCVCKKVAHHKKYQVERLSPLTRVQHAQLLQKKRSDLMSVERIESDCDGCIVMSVVNAREHNDNSICCYLVYQKCATHHLDGYPTIATLMG